MLLVNTEKNNIFASICRIRYSPKCYKLFSTLSTDARVFLTMKFVVNL